MDASRKIIASNAKRISLKNLYLPFILLAVSIILVSIIPTGSIGVPMYAHGNKEIKQAYSEGKDFIHCSFDTLYYSNFDYYRGDEVVGYYYYSLEDDSCIFVLLPASDPSSAREPIISDYSCTAKLEKNDDSFKSFITQFAADIGWDAAGVSNITANFTVDQFTRSIIWYYIIFVITIIILFVCIAFIALTILCIIKPKYLPAFFTLKKVFGKTNNEYYAIETELMQNTSFHTGSVYVTKDYIIECGHLSMDIVPLSSIVWMYSFTRMHTINPKKPLTYSICVYTDPYHRFIFHRKSRQCVDELTQYINKIMPNVVTEYTPEMHEKMEFLRKHK